MIRKIMTGLLAITMALNITSSLTAYAKENTSKVTIKTVPPQEWLDEGNYEFSVEFNGDKTKHAFLDKDNGFENTVELTMMQSYTVSFSDEVANYEIGGIDTDFFIPDKEEMTVVLSFKGSGNIAKTNDDGKISEEQAERLAEARNVVNQAMEIYDANEDALLECDGLFYVTKSGCGFFDEVGYYNSDVWDNLTKRDKFVLAWFKWIPNLEINYDSPNQDDRFVLDGLENNIRDFCMGKEEQKEIMREIANPVWLWLYAQSQKYGDVPDLFTVYMDIENGVEYEAEDGDKTKIEETTTASPETAPELSVSEVSEAQEVSAPTDDKSSAIEPPMTMSTKQKSSAPLIIGGIIAVIAVGAAAFILGKRSKK